MASTTTIHRPPPRAARKHKSGRRVKGSARPATPSKGGGEGTGGVVCGRGAGGGWWVQRKCSAMAQRQHRLPSACGGVGCAVAGRRARSNVRGVSSDTHVRITPSSSARQVCVPQHKRQAGSVQYGGMPIATTRHPGTGPPQNGWEGGRWAGGGRGRVRQAQVAGGGARCRGSNRQAPNSSCSKAGPNPSVYHNRPE